MVRLSFSTDNKLNICSWGKAISEFTQKSPVDVLGYKYYEVLPRIVIDSRDALITAIKKKKKQSCKGFRFHCFHTSLDSDVRIIPIISANNQVVKTKVDISLYSPCAAVENLKNPEKLTDVGKMATMLAHGVRNPLNAIKGSVVYLKGKYNHDETFYEFIKIMEDEITRLENFISRFLSSSFLDSEHSFTNINSLIKKIQTLIAFQMQSHNVKPFFSYGCVPAVPANPFHIEQAILNVINNAVEAMTSGGTLRVKTMTQSESDKAYAIIEVIDTGPGIIGNRNDVSLPTVPINGRGFGLSITREIVNNCGGRIEISSKKNSGTNVKIFLPFA